MLTVLYGNSELLRRETLASLTNREDPSGFATTRFPPGTPLASIAAAARTPAFFAERRLIVAEGLLSDALRVNTLDQELLDLIRTLPESCHLITIEPLLPQEAIQRLTTHLGVSVEFISCIVPSGKEMVRWVRERARSYGVEIEPDAAEEFVLALAPTALQDRHAEINSDRSETNSVDLTRINTELAKLAVAVYPATVIRVADVRTFVSPDEPPLEWALIDAVQRGQFDVIVRELERALDTGNPPELLLGQLAGYFEGLVAALTQPDLSPDVVAAVTGVAARRIAQLRRQRSQRTIEQAREALAMLRTIDAGFKRGIVPDMEAALVAALLSFGQQARPSPGSPKR